jgi:hypothetical protein
MYVFSAGGARETTRCRPREALADTRIIGPPVGERYGSFSRAMSMPSASSPRVRGRVGFLLVDEERQFLLGARGAYAPTHQRAPKRDDEASYARCSLDHVKSS